MNKVLFPYLSWCLFLLIPITFLGFYPSYFSRLVEPMSSIYHFHAFFMMLWVSMAIAQPFFIQSNKIETHKLIGKLSYIIMPFVFITGYLVLSHTYSIDILKNTADVAKGKSDLTETAIKSKAAASIIVGFVYYVWLVLFYLMAIINRKKLLFHATYMFAAILTVLGPTMERLLYNVITYLKLPYGLFSENAVIIFIFMVLISLSIYQSRKKNLLKPSLIALSIYAVGMMGQILLPSKLLWSSFINFIV